MSDEENGTERVTQLWPTDLKKKVQERVGQRGVTRFTLEAIREKLAKLEAEEIVKEAIGETPAIDEEALRRINAEAAPTPVVVVEREEPAPVVGMVEHSSKLIEGETRGADVAVQTMSTGAAAEYASSRARVEAMLAKAESMGIKKAADLPVPPKPVVEEIAAPDQVEETVEEVFDPDVYEETIPDDQPTLQEELAAMKVLERPVPVAVQTPARNLDDVEVDF